MDDDVDSMTSAADRDALHAYERCGGDADAQAQIRAAASPGAIERALAQREASFRRNLAQAIKAERTPAPIYEQYRAALAAGDQAKAARIAAAHPRVIANGHDLDRAVAAEREAKLLDELDGGKRLRQYRELLQTRGPHVAAIFRAQHSAKIADAETRLRAALKGR